MNPKSVDNGVKDEMIRLMDKGNVAAFVDLATREGAQRLGSLDETAHRLILMILRVGDLITYDNMVTILRPLGLTSAGHYLMWVIWLTGPIEGTAAAKLMGASRASVSGIANTLEREGLIGKVPSAKDGRAMLLSLTDRGRKQLELAMQGISNSAGAMLNALTKQETATLLSLLEKVATATIANSRTRS